MEEKTRTPGLFRRTWDLYRKTFVPSAAVMTLYTAVLLLMNFYLFPQDLVISPEEGSLSAGFVGKILAGGGLLGLLSLFSLLFVISLAASRQEGRPWSWSVGLNLSLEKIFPFASSVILIFFQLLALTMLVSLAGGLILGVKDASQLSLIMMLQLAAAGLIGTFFLVVYIFLPQVLLVEKHTFFLGLRRAAYLSRKKRLRIFGFFLTVWSPVILLQVYAVLAAYGGESGGLLPYSQQLIMGLGIAAQVSGIFLTPLFCAGSTVLYYDARSREVNLEA